MNEETSRRGSVDGTQNLLFLFADISLFSDGDAIYPE